MLTIFSTPKPFAGHIGMIQRNAIGSWLSLGSKVEVLLIGDEEGLPEVAQEMGVQHIHEVECNQLGTPLVSSIFQIARETSQYPTLCYVNADIIFLGDILQAVDLVQDRFDSYMMIGQRWDLDLRERITFEEGWENEIERCLQMDGRLHPPAGSDYFVFKREDFRHIPPFALGRAGWDNWMIYAGRAARIPVVDATMITTVIHQDHDYAHLPEGQPHYRLPESDENVRLSGGQETIFTLSDANWKIEGMQVKRRSWQERWRRRGIETSLISIFGPGLLSRLVRMILYPGEAISYYWKAFLRRFLSSSESAPATGKEEN